MTDVVGEEVHVPIHPTPVSNRCADGCLFALGCLLTPFLELKSALSFLAGLAVFVIWIYVLVLNWDEEVRIGGSHMRVYLVVDLILGACTWVPAQRVMRTRVKDISALCLLSVIHQALAVWAFIEAYHNALPDARKLPLWHVDIASAVINQVCVALNVLLCLCN